MKTKVSSKGYVMVGKPLLRKLGLRPGDSIVVRMHGDAIVLHAVRKRVRRKAIIIKDPRTGLSVLGAGKGAPKLTHKQIRALLDGFP